MMVLSWLGEVLYPSKCILCGRVLGKQETDLCGKCRINAPCYPYSRAKPAPKGILNLRFLDSFTSVWYYEDDVRRSIHRFKFCRAAHLSAGYGRMVAMRLEESFPEGFDYLTWVPVSTLRRMRRGYDQAELLARAVGRELRFPPVRLLKKIRNTRPQFKQATPEARRANVAGAYAPYENMDLAGKRVVLLDDIYTTGATASECGRILRQMGAGEVHIVTIAAALRR